MPSTVWERSHPKKDAQKWHYPPPQSLLFRTKEEHSTHYITFIDPLRVSFVITCFLFLFQPLCLVSTSRKLVRTEFKRACR
ncbi:hypothetical protein BDV23DRAFT_141603 [Aspergillus alliaceus]|uniref:Uncharacterized protein n=1 Tax=Petromyces alliaceus TaxID=209559 RepID=A0A5N7BXG4_PETAA|nr:hypothetical protein BDV23DRAFT_141603 [Aspergillus alliaceus]